MKRTSFLFKPTLFTLLCTASMFHTSTVSATSTYSVIVDDYAAPLTWNYSRIGTDRGKMGYQDPDTGLDLYSVSISNGAATVSVADVWGGIWTSLFHLAVDNDQLDSTKVFGPYIKPAWQGHITGVELDIQNATVDIPLKVELLDANKSVPYSQSFTLTGAKETLHFTVSPTVPLKLLNWSVVDVGQATVDEVRVLVDVPQQLTPEQEIFLFSYGHLSQCYDPATGLVRDQSQWPANEAAAVQSTGMFALATATAYQLGYIEKTDAETIVKNTAAALKALATPGCHGLLPHFVTNGAIVPGTEWSSIDTVIALTANLLAAQSLNLSQEAADMQTMLQAIDWSDLTDGYTANPSMGYDTGCTSKLTAKWDSFGSERFLIAMAFTSAQPNKTLANPLQPNPPTWDGSGFNDELAALFFPMRGTDSWGNDWNNYRCDAFNKQWNYFAAMPDYASRGLFGLSAAEVPEPWVNSPTYGAWGIGGWGVGSNDGSAVTGYPIVAPHYASMICKEHSSACRKFFNYLISQNTFSPLNNTESVGIQNGGLKWSSLKGSWNLSMQALGAARALSGNDFAPYKALQQNAFLLASYNKLMPKQGGAPCSTPIPFVYNLLMKKR